MRTIEHCWIEMTDHVRLSARIWLPETADPVPAILEYIPYRKRDMVRARDERNHPVFARHSYAAVRVDMRGSGCSEGLMPDMYGNAELDDALTVIAWIADQPWCDGSVGMMGTSWGGTASLQAAARRPDALKAIIAVCATDNRFDDDIHHMGGCLLSDSVEWGAALPAILALPPDPKTVGPAWREIWTERLEALTFPLENWIRHETRDDYWRHGSVSEQPGAIACPVLAIGGWVDRYANTVMNLLAEVEQSWGIVGSWGHHYPDVAEPGPGIDFQQEALRWWDHWLKGDENGIADEPRLRVWMQEFSEPADRLVVRPGRWIAEAAWPSPTTTPLRYHLAPGALRSSRSVAEDGKATAVIPDTPKVGLAAGDSGYFGREGGLPLDQRREDAPALTFDTKPLEAPLEILGHTVLTLKLETRKPVATLAVRLCDVAPDGTVARVTYGIRNLALDDRHAGRREAGEPVTITLPNTAYRFAKGHRIRLALSTSYWPQIWPTPTPAAITADLATASLDLPVRRQPDRTLTVNLAPIADRPAAPAAEPSIVRSVQHSDAGGDVTVGWHQPRSATVFNDIDLEFAREIEGEHRMPAGDPERALTRFIYRFWLTRGDWEVDVVGTASLTSTPTDFLPEGAVEVRENGEVIFERNWSKKIPRTVS